MVLSFWFKLREGHWFLILRWPDSSTPHAHAAPCSLLNILACISALCSLLTFLSVLLFLLLVGFPLGLPLFYFYCFIPTIDLQQLCMLHLGWSKMCPLACCCSIRGSTGITISSLFHVVTWLWFNIAQKKNHHCFYGFRRCCKIDLHCSYIWFLDYSVMKYGFIIEVAFNGAAECNFCIFCQSPEWSNEILVCTISELHHIVVGKNGVQIVESFILVPWIVYSFVTGVRLSHRGWCF